MIMEKKGKAIDTKRFCAALSDKVDTINDETVRVLTFVIYINCAHDLSRVLESESSVWNFSDTWRHLFVWENRSSHNH